MGPITWAYIRISTDKQELLNQKLLILEWANSHNIKIDKWIQTIGSAAKKQPKEIYNLLNNITCGDNLVISELSRIGRSTSEIINLINLLTKKGVNLFIIKENIFLNPNKKTDITSKVIITIFSLLAELERDLISERTKMALARAKMQGKRLGRPKGSLGKSKLDGKEKIIRELLLKRVTKSNIAKILGCSRTTLINFIKTRKLEKD